ncbi:MAG: S9 family peptidase [Flavobacteriaceae bacterium]
MSIVNKITPPKPKKILKILRKFKCLRKDNYYWLKNRENTDVINHLKEENNYYDKMTSHTNEFQKKLFDEIKGKIKEDDESVPYFFNGYWYISRYEKNKSYPIYLRKKKTLSAKEEILFDCNLLSKDYPFFNLSNFCISPNNKFVAFSIDTKSRRLYTIKIKNLENGEILNKSFSNCSGAMAWANDNSTLFYVKRELKTLRPHKVFKCDIRSKTSNEKLVFFEKDTTFYTNISKSKSGTFLIICSYSTLTTEFRFLNSDFPNKKFIVFSKRKRGLEYTISHYDNHFYIITNKDDCYNYKLMKTSIHNTDIKYWTNVIDHREEILLESIDIFKNYLVITERINGLIKIKIKKWNKKSEYYLEFNSETYNLQTTNNIDFNTNILRYSYSSFNEPARIVDFDMRTKKKILRKEQKIIDQKFKIENYITERKWAKANDGKLIPISIIYKNGVKKNSKNPLLIYGYGSYGHTIDPYFSISRLSLLDRGFVFAIAHVRGSEYLGRKWYEDGKLLKKMNTFNDFISCTKYLIKNKYTNPKKCYAYGGSAGGLLMGVIINLSPELYNGIIAAVPFVDVISTMLDDKIPLTTSEYDEWGNPNKKKYFEYISNYSPYDNIKKLNYPNILVTTGLHDSQVQYWEPAKWVAKLRDFKKSKNKVLLSVDMDSGHGGASGRYDSIKDTAKEYAFLLDHENIYK